MVTFILSFLISFCVWMIFCIIFMVATDHWSLAQIPWYKHDRYSHSFSFCAGTFGPSFWEFLHMTSFAYSGKEKTKTLQQIHKNMYSNLEHMLPCKACAKNYPSSLQSIGGIGKLEEALSSSDPFAYAKFVTDLHNAVNKRLKRREWTFEQVQMKYKNLRLGKNPFRKCYRNKSIFFKL